MLHIFHALVTELKSYHVTHSEHHKIRFWALIKVGHMTVSYLLTWSGRSFNSSQHPGRHPHELVSLLGSSSVDIFPH